MAINAVKNIYQGAVTKVKTPVGKTEAINVDREVQQGDTLSPFLFNCFTEPLTRWLQVGGRGYSIGCMTKADDKLQMKCRTASCGYADDTTLFTSTVSDMALHGKSGAVLIVGKPEAEHQQMRSHWYATAGHGEARYPFAIDAARLCETETTTCGGQDKWLSCTICPS